LTHKGEGGGEKGSAWRDWCLDLKKFESVGSHREKVAVEGKRRKLARIRGGKGIQRAALYPHGEAAASDSWREGGDQHGALTSTRFPAVWKGGGGKG